MTPETTPEAPQKMDWAVLEADLNESLHDAGFPEITFGSDHNQNFTLLRGAIANLHQAFQLEKANRVASDGFSNMLVQDGIQFNRALTGMFR